MNTRGTTSFVQPLVSTSLAQAKKLAKQVRKEEKASAKKEAKRARKVALPPPPPLPPMASERRESPAEVDRQRHHDGRPQEGDPKRQGDSHRRGGDYRSGSHLDSDRRAPWITFRQQFSNSPLWF